VLPSADSYASVIVQYSSADGLIPGHPSIFLTRETEYVNHPADTEEYGHKVPQDPGNVLSDEDA
jgi:hypothetical protein